MKQFAWLCLVYFSSCCLLLAWGSLAYAEGSVLKQKECLIMVSGLSETKIGGKIEVNTLDEEVLSASIKKLMPNGNVTATFDDTSNCPEVIGATATLSAEDSDDQTASPAKSTLGSNPWKLGRKQNGLRIAFQPELSMIGASGQAGWGASTFVLHSLKSGFEDLRIRYGLGARWLRGTYSQESTSTSTYTSTNTSTTEETTEETTSKLSSWQVVPMIGFEMTSGSLAPYLSGLFAYGVSNSYKSTFTRTTTRTSTETAAPEPDLKVSSFFLYGIETGMDVMISKSLGMGAFAVYSVGTFAISSTSSSATTTSASTNSSSIVTSLFGGRIFSVF